jgi:hypothetical protein
MTPTEPDATSPLDDAFIDRIVDGDLSPAQLGAALDRLDRTPDGWRRCALAFLESQCWRESLRAPVELVGLPTASVRSTRPSFAAEKRPVTIPWTRGVIAAGFAAVAFATGWLSHPPYPASEDRDVGPQRAPAVAADDRKVSTSQSEGPVTVDALSPAGYGEFAPPPEPRFRPDSSDSVVMVGRLRIGPPGGSTEVPIFAGPQIDEEWLQNQPPALDEYQRALLERQGYQVDQQRRIITAILPDGRRVSVPIDQVQVLYTGNNAL